MSADLDSSQLDAMIGRKLGGYTITRCVGKGGMGMVYEAKHQHMSQRAAVKVLNQAVSADPKVVQRFFNEAKALSLVQHPCVVKVFEFGQLDDGTAFIMMEFLDGKPLSHYIAQAQQAAPGIELPLAVELGTQIAAALAVSHAKGVVHRDLKPENVFLVPDPLLPRGLRVKLLDFGIAKFLEGEARRTTVGMILGTPLYMSPEQCEGSQELDAKVDVYALGVMLYEMIAGRLPFNGDTNAAILRQHLFKEPPPLAEQRTELPVALTALVHRMLAKAAADRPTMPEVFAAMNDFLPPSDQKLSGLRQELALHLTPTRQHVVSAETDVTDPLAPTLGNPTPGGSVTPPAALRRTPVTPLPQTAQPVTPIPQPASALPMPPITLTINRRLPLLLGVLLALGLLGALVIRLIPSSPRRAAITTNAALPVVIPTLTVVPKIEATAAATVPAAVPAAVPAKPEPAAPAEPAASPAPEKPAEPVASVPEERKNRPKGAKSRPAKAKSTAGQVPPGAPAHVVDEPWR